MLTPSTKIFNGIPKLSIKLGGTSFRDITCSAKWGSEGRG